MVFARFFTTQKWKEVISIGRSSLWTILTRIITVIAGLVLVGIVLKLVGAILGPVLPPQLMDGLRSGWHMLYGLAGPAIPATMALLILGALIWIIAGRR